MFSKVYCSAALIFTMSLVGCSASAVVVDAGPMTRPSGAVSYTHLTLPTIYSV